MNASLVSQIAQELKLQDYQVSAVVQLTSEDCTVPFIARYRKERTGTLDEVQIRAIIERYNYVMELEKLKEQCLAVIRTQAEQKPELKPKLPEIEKQVRACQTKQQLEDVYMPYRPKRRTKAQIATEKGLEPLAKLIMTKLSEGADLLVTATPFVNATNEKIAAELRVQNEAEALQGASDIVAEQLSESASIRDLVRRLMYATGRQVAKANTIDDALGKVRDAKKTAKFQEKMDKFTNYFDYDEPIGKIPPHRIMALRRGESEKCLIVNLVVDEPQILQSMKDQILQDKVCHTSTKEWLEAMVKSSYRRLLSPSIETEIRLELKERAEKEAIRVFSDNLGKLLMLPPIPSATVCGIDPGVRTGSKCAVVSSTGTYVDAITIYPNFSDAASTATDEARKNLRDLLISKNVGYIAIGNGTGSEKIGQLVAELLKSEPALQNVKRLIVNEAGASVYSTDDIAREEFPDLDVTIRSAISIARRLQDPLSELVKIEPRSIGVGQYQHDLNATKLGKSLAEVVESCVNKVGVDLNTASYKLLSYVSGIRATVAKNIVQHRDKNGPFKNRQELLEVSGFGGKAFEQAAGFLRIKGGTNPLDNSSVHPERYEIVQKIAEDLKQPIAALIEQEHVVKSIPIENYVSETVGLPTLKDIVDELIKPGRDPRSEGSRLAFSADVSSIEDLKVDMVLPGTVTNVTNFGAFVDIGVHHNGLIHISELSNQFVKDATQMIHVGDVIEVKVIDIDLKRKRISLSTKTAQTQTPPPSRPRQQDRPPQSPQGQGPRGQRPPQQGQRPPHRGQNQQNRGHRPPQHGQRPPQHQGPRPVASSQRRDHKPSKPEQNYTLDDLMAKFKTK